MSYGPGPGDTTGTNIYGATGHLDFSYTSFEVFTIAPAGDAVPEPGALVLILPTLGLLGGLRRRQVHQ